MPIAFLTAVPTTAAETFLQTVGTTLASVVEWFGTLIDALLSADGALASLFPFVAITFCIGLVYGVIRIVKTFVPGF